MTRSQSRAASWPDRVEITGLHAPVRITLGALRVPTVEADSLVDAWCGLGYAVGRERLFQLDLMRRTAAGRLAELFGPGSVDADGRQRRLGFAEIAAAAPVDDAVRAYAAGIRLAFDHGGAPTEYRLLGLAEVEPWRPADCVLAALLLTQQLSLTGRDRRMRDVMARCLPREVTDFLLTDADPYRVDASGKPAHPRTVEVPVDRIREVLADGPAAARSVLPADDGFWGSNALVVGDRTEGGRALLANDMHLPLTAPALMYRATMRWADRQVSGLTVPGVPAFVAGVTDDLAWGATRLAADTVDLVELDVSPDGRYRTADGWAEFTSVPHRIEVRGAEPVEIEARRTVWGPVVGTPLDGYPLALHWAALEPGGVDFGLSALLTARDVAEAVDVVRVAGGPALNVLVADRRGGTGWAVSGRHPDRPDNSTDGIVRPRLGQSTWTATLAPERLPGVTDPDGGLFVSANNRVPEHGSLAENQFGARRAARFVELVNRPGLREADLLAAQADQDAGFYDFYRDLALSVLAPGDQLRDGIEAWDGTARPDAVGLATLVVLRELLREAWLSALLACCVRADPEFVYCWHSHEAPLRALLSSGLAPPPYPDHGVFLRTELQVCRAILAKMAPGRDPGRIRWGEINPSGARHVLSAARPDLAELLDLPADAPGGCAESVCATRPGFGPAMRFVAAPGHGDEALVNLPGGQSGDPDDPAYRDQFPAWLAALPQPLLDPPTGETQTWLLPGGPSC